MSYADLTLKISAYLLEQSKQWEQTRYLASIIVNVNRPAKKAAIAPEKLMKLPTDPKPKSISNTIADMFAFINKFE
jgi:hypothetical protein